MERLLLIVMLYFGSLLAEDTSINCWINSETIQADREIKYCKEYKSDNGWIFSNHQNNVQIEKKKNLLAFALINNDTLKVVENDSTITVFIDEKILFEKTSAQLISLKANENEAVFYFSNSTKVVVTENLVREFKYLLSYQFNGDDVFLEFGVKTTFACFESDRKLMDFYRIDCESKTKIDDVPFTLEAIEKNFELEFMDKELE